MVARIWPKSGLSGICAFAEANTARGQSLQEEGIYFRGKSQVWLGHRDARRVQVLSTAPETQPHVAVWGRIDLRRQHPDRSTHRKGRQGMTRGLDKERPGVRIERSFELTQPY